MFLDSRFELSWHPGGKIIARFHHRIDRGERLWQTKFAGGPRSRFKYNMGLDKRRIAAALFRRRIERSIKADPIQIGLTFEERSLGEWGRPEFEARFPLIAPCTTPFAAALPGLVGEDYLCRLRDAYHRIELMRVETERFGLHRCNDDTGN